MMREPSSTPMRRALPWLTALVLLFTGASASGSTVTRIFFDGPCNDGTAGSCSGDVIELGVSQTTAEGSGLDIVAMPGDVVSGSSVGLSSSIELLHETAPPQGSTGPAFGLADFTVSASEDQLGDAYLVFIGQQPYDTQRDGQTIEIDYDGPLTGFDVDPDEGWVIFTTLDSFGRTVYLPAIALGLMEESDDFTFQLNMEITDGVVQLLDDPENRVAFPQWVTAVVVTVPEPATLILLAAGLVGLSWFGRRRS